MPTFPNESQNTRINKKLEHRINRLESKNSRTESELKVDNDNYKKLQEVLHMAYDHASIGKGKERHAELNENFEDQIICEVSDRLKNHGETAGVLFQAVKKIYESGKLDNDKAIHELIGAINYISAAVILLKRI